MASSNGRGSPKRSKPATLEFFWDDLRIEQKPYSAGPEVQDQVIHRLQNGCSPGDPRRADPGIDEGTLRVSELFGVRTDFQASPHEIHTGLPTGKQEMAGEGRADPPRRSEGWAVSLDREIKEEKGNAFQAIGWKRVFTPGIARRTGPRSLAE